MAIRLQLHTDCPVFAMDFRVAQDHVFLYFLYYPYCHVILNL